MPPPMFLEHQTFPDIEVKICFLPQNKCMICCDSLCPLPLQLIYNHGHTIWDKKMNRYREHLNEHIGNLIGTQWEHTRKNKKSPLHPQKRNSKKKKKNYAPWIFSLPTWKFYLENNLPLFSLYKLGVLTDMCPYFSIWRLFFFLLCSFILENHLFYFNF